MNLRVRTKNHRVALCCHSLLLAGAICTGLYTRRGPHIVAHYAAALRVGDVCYALAAFAVVGIMFTVAGVRHRKWATFGTSMLLCALVELSQLIRQPALDAFRGSGAHWFIGYRYSHEDMVALGVGNVLALALMHVSLRNANYNSRGDD
jgi:Protein of unknown function (DUF2809)